MTFKCEFELIKKFCRFVFFIVIFFNFILISKLHANSFKINEIEVSEDFNLDFNKEKVFDKAFENSAMNDELLESNDSGIATLTMNRPLARNALTPQMMTGLRESLPRLAADTSVRVVVLTGAGNAFCAGGDVKRFAEASHSDPSRQQVRQYRPSCPHARP